MVASCVRRDLSSLARSTFDVLVIGGGIVGACAARDATLRGLRVALIERDDFAGGISWNSLKIIHGGLRSLQSLDVRQARQFVHERRAWLTIAPHLVEPIAFIVPTRGAGGESALVMRAGLALNDIVSRDRNEGVQPSRRLPRGRAISRAELQSLAPALAAGHGAGVLFHDAQLYSAERLVMAVLDDAVRAGATIANYAEAIDPFRERDALAGVVVEDRASGDRFDVRAPVIVNAAGAGAARVAARLTGRGDAVAPMRAIALNLMLAGDAGGVGMAIPARESGALRRLFVAPWRGRMLAGTAHYPCEREPRSPEELEPYVERFVGELSAAWPTRSLTRDDVLLVHAGMQPDLPGHGPPEHRIVDHAYEGVPQLLTAIGPKLTTSRAVAEELIDQASKRLGLPSRSCETAVRPLASAPAEDCSALVARALAADRAGLPDDVLTHLVRSYGAGHHAVLAMVRDEPALAQRIEAGSPVIAAQLAYGAREEMAMRADDLVYRRTELASTARATPHGTSVAEAQLRRAESPGGRESRSR